jgi:MFS family permease
MHRTFHYNLNNPDQANAWYLVVEIFWASMLAAAATFNSAFALRLGASNTQVGWLTSLPALVAVLVSMPAGRFLQRRARRKAWVLAALTVYRMGFIVMAFVPWMHVSDINQGALVVAVLVAISIPVHFFNVGFLPMLSEVVPEKQRASVFSIRNIVYNIALSISVFLFGIWLERITFPENYLVMYLFGFGCTILSLIYLIKVKVPDASVALAKPVKG